MTGSTPLPGAYLDTQLVPTDNGALRKALFLDRDGVINVDHGYVHTPEQTEWVPGIFDVCARARDAGYVLVVITNQAGIARGYYSEDEFLQYTRWIHGEFRAKGVPLAATYYCPHHPESGVGLLRVKCDCRKPNPGMLLAAARDLSLSLSDSVMIGDMPKDREASLRAGVGRYVSIEDAQASPLSVLA
jgi:D-glycero-D-manno-heptose 1,7-bisphosphate phosphatase